MCHCLNVLSQLELRGSIALALVALMLALMVAWMSLVVAWMVLVVPRVALLVRVVRRLPSVVGTSVLAPGGWVVLPLPLRVERGRGGGVGCVVGVAGPGCEERDRVEVAERGRGAFEPTPACTTQYHTRTVQHDTTQQQLLAAADVRAWFL